MIIPEHDGIYTFMDCPDRSDDYPILQNLTGNYCGFPNGNSAQQYLYCQGYLTHRCCPRGYAR